MASRSVLLLVATVTSAPTAASTVHLTVEVQHLIATTPPTFLAHGWEPFTASGSFPDFKTRCSKGILPPAWADRFGGITANFLHYFEGAAESPPCDYGKYCRHCGGAECPFTTANFDALLDFLSDAGVTVVFDFNELTRAGTAPSRGSNRGSRHSSAGRPRRRGTLGPCCCSCGTSNDAKTAPIDEPAPTT